MLMYTFYKGTTFSVELHQFMSRKLNVKNSFKSFPCGRSGLKAGKGKSSAKLEFFFPLRCLCHVVFIQLYLNIWYEFLLFALKRLHQDRVSEGTDHLLGAIFMSIGQQVPFQEKGKLQICHFVSVSGKLFLLFSPIKKTSLKQYDKQNSFHSFWMLLLHELCWSLGEI